MAAKTPEGTAFGPRQSELLAGLAVWHCPPRADAPIQRAPTSLAHQDQHDRPHQQSRGEFLASPDGAGEPGPGDGSGALCSDVVAAVRHLPGVMDEGLQFGPRRG